MSVNDAYTLYVILDFATTGLIFNSTIALQELEVSIQPASTEIQEGVRVMVEENMEKSNSRKEISNAHLS
jgi:hypothetical protein